MEDNFLGEQDFDPSGPVPKQFDRERVLASELRSNRKSHNFRNSYVRKRGCNRCTWVLEPL